MTQTRALLAGGASLRAAVRGALGGSLRGFARRHRLSRRALARALAGTAYPSEALVLALTLDLDGSPMAWRALFAQQRQSAVAPTPPRTAA